MRVTDFLQNKHKEGKECTLDISDNHWSLIVWGRMYKDGGHEMVERYDAETHDELCSMLDQEAV